jgi:hypothetical protein
MRQRLATLLDELVCVCVCVYVCVCVCVCVCKLYSGSIKAPMYVCVCVRSLSGHLSTWSRVGIPS